MGGVDVGVSGCGGESNVGVRGCKGEWIWG